MKGILQKIAAVLVVLISHATAFALTNNQGVAIKSQKVNALWIEGFIPEAESYNNDDQYKACNATRISKEWFITGGDCFGWGELDDFEWTDFELRDAVTGKSYPIIEHVLHPDAPDKYWKIHHNIALFRSPKYSEDLCLANNQNSTTICDQIAEIQPPILLDVFKDDIARKTATAMSWHLNAGANETPSGWSVAPYWIEGFTSGRFDIAGDNECFDRSDYTIVDVPPYMLCVANDKTPNRTCPKDAGSAMYIREFFAENILVGISSGGGDDCDHILLVRPSYYYLIAEDIAWIKSVVGAENLRLASDYYQELDDRNKNEDSIILDILPLL